MTDCAGLWQRTLLVDPCGVYDTTTDVRWLQGITRFVDLRRATPRPDFSGVRSAADLTAGHWAWLDTQDGFAGTLTQRADIFHWQRRVELQPPGPHPDEGAMSYADGVLVEAGVHADYFEHWIRAAAPGPCWAMDLESPAGGSALVLRVGDLFGWAHRDPAGAVELSLGTIADGEWLITDSSLPYREGQFLQSLWAAPEHDWRISYTEGNVTA
ncbi:hypothetical protein ACFXG4_40010 [Nocardia sp. NPDC059246]|uniref:hypothetical protein n=1 Tax=unclassified Nocardia TaxID=2637762 RepID=UPI0036781DB2